MNAHSSRSHAILCVKVAISTGAKTRISTASAIDLAGSEDNRRTDNDKERMVESASINKSLFVLAQCVEAISKKQQRIPYRESKMTRILALGQNNGLTLMILNLAPVRSYHLDTLSSLNFANRTKKIEVREVENEPIFKGPARPAARAAATGSMQRQPLRPLAASVNANISAQATKDASKPGENKPVKAFYVYSDKPQTKPASAQTKKPEVPKRSSPRRSSPIKRSSDAYKASASRLAKLVRQEKPTAPNQRMYDDMSAAKIEEMVEKKVEEILAARALNEPSKQETQIKEINEQVQRRLELLEQRIEGTEDARAEGLSYLLMAKQHHARGEDASALRMYELALPFFPHNEKLAKKISALQEKLKPKSQVEQEPVHNDDPITAARSKLGSMLSIKKEQKPARSKRRVQDVDEDYEEPERDEQFSEEDYEIRPKKKRARSSPSPVDADVDSLDEHAHSPRTARLLSIVNSRDVSQIKLLKGVGAKKAEAIVDCLCEMDHQLESADYAGGETQAQVKSLAQLGRLKGVGLKTVQNMRAGLVV